MRATRVLRLISGIALLMCFLLAITSRWYRTYFGFALLGSGNVEIWAEEGGLSVIWYSASDEDGHPIPYEGSHGLAVFYHPIFWDEYLTLDMAYYDYGTHSLTQIPFLLLTIVGAGLFGGSCVLARILRNRIAFPACQRCGYNLTGNVSGRCPECGNPLVSGRH
jgi:hypothetical protein